MYDDFTESELTNMYDYAYHHYLDMTKCDVTEAEIAGAWKQVRALADALQRLPQPLDT